MARLPQEEVVFDDGEAAPRRRSPLAVARGLADWALAALFFAVVSFAALPMGANRDWAWAPIATIVSTRPPVVRGRPPKLGIPAARPPSIPARPPLERAV